MASLRIHALTSNRWFWGKFIFCNNFITFHANSYKSIACRWEKQLFFSPHLASNIQRHFTQQIASQCVSHTQAPWRQEERKRVELIFWCFDKVKCHWETKILLKASLAAFFFLSSLPLDSWIMWMLRLSLWKIYDFIVFIMWRWTTKNFSLDLLNHMSLDVTFNIFQGKKGEDGGKQNIPYCQVTSRGDNSIQIWLRHFSSHEKASL